MSEAALRMAIDHFPVLDMTWPLGRQQVWWQLFQMLWAEAGRHESRHSGDGSPAVEKPLSR